MTFEIRVPFGTNSHALKKGETIAIDFPDGKGVSAKIADVSIAPGGTPFSIICTEDGESPITEQLHAAAAYHGAVLTVRAEARREAGDMTTGQLMEAYAAAQESLELQRQQLQEAAGQAREVDTLTSSVQSLMEQLTATEARLRDTEAARAEWEQNSRNWEAQYQTLSEMTRPITVHNHAGPQGEAHFYQPRGDAPVQQVLGVEEMTGTGSLDLQTAARETFQIESPRSRVRVSYDPDGSVEIEIQKEEQ